MKVKARFKDGEFIPIGGVEGVEEDEVVEIEVGTPRRFSWKGALKDVEKGSVEVQHSISDRW